MIVIYNSNTVIMHSETISKELLIFASNQEGSILNYILIFQLYSHFLVRLSVIARQL